MLANPVPERQLEALQRLLRHLSASGNIAALARLPLAGTIALGGSDSSLNRPGKEGGPRMLSLADEARRFLAQRASHADLSARPQPYQVSCKSTCCWLMTSVAGKAHRFQEPIAGSCTLAASFLKCCRLRGPISLLFD